MKKIKLTQGKYALVDNFDFEWLSQWKWGFSPSGHSEGKGYASRTMHLGYDKNHKRLLKRIYMHRAILHPPTDMVSDHINGNGLDNRRSNLRAVTKAENYILRSKKLGSKSKYKGVTTSGKKWQARIAFKGEQYYLGTYPTELGARLVYLRAAKHLHGEYAR